MAGEVTGDLWMGKVLGAQGKVFVSFCYGWQGIKLMSFMNRKCSLAELVLDIQYNTIIK